MFIFTNAKYGYYIHGKSPNGNADASMKEMIFGFEKESYGLVGKRGLAPDREAKYHIAFSIQLFVQKDNMRNKCFIIINAFCINYI